MRQKVLKNFFPNYSGGGGGHGPFWPGGGYAHEVMDKSCLRQLEAVINGFSFY